VGGGAGFVASSYVGVDGGVGSGGGVGSDGGVGVSSD